MNYSAAIFLVNPDARAVAVSYELAPEGTKPKTTIFKTLDQTVDVGDFVIVPTDTRHNMTVVRVEEVDLDLDPDTTLDLKWLIGKVDRAAHEAVVRAEAEAIQAIKSAERRAKKEELAKKLLNDNPAIAALRGIHVEPGTAAIGFTTPDLEEAAPAAVPADPDDLKDF